jgi:hypothetical protein
MKRLLSGMALGALLALAGCGGSGGSVSGGSHDPGKAVCQACTVGSECESGNCRQFTSGIWRCVPRDVKPGYVCPGGMYSLQGKESCE